MKSKIEKYQVYADFVPVTGGTVENATSTSGETISFKIRHPDGSLKEFPPSDFFINLSLNKQNKIDQYIDISQQDNIEKLQRQQINPFFIEFSFFDSIKRNKINKGKDLSKQHIDFIREKRPDINALYPQNEIFSIGGEELDGNDRIRLWFNQIGKNELPWNEGSEDEVTINDLDKLIPNVQNIISKADLFNININR